MLAPSAPHTAEIATPSGGEEEEELSQRFILSLSVNVVIGKNGGGQHCCLMFNTYGCISWIRRETIYTLMELMSLG